MFENHIKDLKLNLFQESVIKFNSRHIQNYLMMTFFLKLTLRVNFVIGAPHGDTGLTGENYCRHIRW